MNKWSALVSGAIAGLAIAGMSSSAARADGSDEARYASSPALAYNWSGIYFGGNAGWMRTKDIGGGFVFPAATGNSFIVPGESRTAYGGQMGFQHQFSNLVVGVEGGFKETLGGFASTPGLGNAPPIGCNAATVFTCEARLKHIEQIGGRLGWASNNWLFYGTGGWALADIATQARTIATGVALAQDEKHHHGNFFGGGIEWAAHKNIILGVEYTHYSFSSQIHDIGGNSRFVSTDADTVTARLSVKFGPEPVVYQPLK